jgi:hypothetical protein
VLDLKIEEIVSELTYTIRGIDVIDIVFNEMKEEIMENYETCMINLPLEILKPETVIKYLPHDKNSWFNRISMVKDIDYSNVYFKIAEEYLY